MGFLDLLLDRPHRAHPRAEPGVYDPRTIVRQTDGVCDLLYHRSYAERCERDDQTASSAWLHAQAVGSASSLLLSEWRRAYPPSLPRKWLKSSLERVAKPRLTNSRRLDRLGGTMGNAGC